MATILVVEDDHFFLELVRLHLLMTGYTVQAANDPAEGLRAIAESSPDLVLLDLDLPYMSGFEVLGALRSDAAYREIPVIVITGRTDGESYIRCKNLGIDGFFSKPLESDKLIEAIATALTARQKK